MGINVTVSVDGDTVDIQPVGSFDFGVSALFREAFQENNPNAKLYRVDLSRVEAMDSSALGLLLILREHANARHSKVVLHSASEVAIHLLATSNFSRIFEVE